MNTRSFTNQTKRTGHAARPSAAASTAGNAVNYPQRRCQARPKRLNSTADWEQAVLHLSQAEQNTRLRQQALAQAQQGNHGRAIALFNQLIKKNPDNAVDYSNRGLVYFQLGRSDAALADYNRAIELNPGLDSVYNNRANYYASQGQFLEAILDYDVALDLNPANTRAWINQGITFRDLEMYERAIESFDLGLCLGKLEGHVYAERGRTYHLRGDWNCAIADYQRALAKLSQPAISNPASSRLQFQVQAWIDELLSFANQ
jgi:tetratricopeptide (TPR) repeat protein